MVSPAEGRSRDSFEDWKNNETLAPLVSEGEFDVISYLGHALEKNQTGLLQELEAASTEVQLRIKNQVTSNLEQLIENSSSLHRLQKLYDDLSSDAMALRVGFQNIKQNVLEPVRRFNEMNEELIRVQCATEVVYAVKRLISLAKRAIELSSGELGLAKLPKLASCVTEAKRVIHSSNLDSIKAMKDYIEEINQIEGKTRDEAVTAFTTAFNALDQSSISTCLLVFFNLGELSEQVGSIMASVAEQVTRRVRKGIETSNSKQRLRSAVWVALESLSSDLMAIILKMWNLERVLKVKLDPITYTPFSVLVTGHAMPLDFVWNFFISCFKSEMQLALESSSFLTTVLIGEFPRLILLFRDQCERLSIQTTSGESEAGEGFSLRHYERLLATLSEVRNRYVSSLLSRLNEPIELMFAGVDGDRSNAARVAAIPTASDVARYLTAVVTAIGDVQECPELHFSVLKGISSSTMLFSMRSANAIDLVKSMDLHPKGGEDGRVKGAGSHASFADLFNNFTQVDEVLEAITGRTSVLLQLFSLENIQASGIDKCRSDIRVKNREILEALLSVSKKEILKAMYGMHDEPVWLLEGDQSSQLDPSKYINKVADEFGFVRRHLLSKFNQSNTSLSIFLAEFCEFILRVFLYNSSLIQSVTPHGLLQLSVDSAKLKSIIIEFMDWDSGEHEIFQQIDRYRRIVFEDVAGVMADTSDLSAIVKVQLLISKIPALPSPYKLMDWTPAKFGVWEAMRPEKQVMDLLKRKYTNLDTIGELQDNKDALLVIRLCESIL